VYDLIEKTHPITGWSRDRGISRYHHYEDMTAEGLWRVESDASLRCGAEFVMPPLDKNVAFSLLEKFFELIDESNCHTSSRCGLHLNISTDDRTVDNVNIGYFMTNINYRLLAKLWPDRVKKYNTFCVGLKHVLSSMLNNKQVHFSSDRQEQRNFQREILKGHNNMINMRFNIGDVGNRFEIRAIGGKNYHKKFEEIKITTNMFEESLKKSCEICEDTHTNKKIISYINRLHTRHDLKNFVWVPTQHGKSVHSEYKILVQHLQSVKNIHKHGAWDFSKKINRIYTSAYSDSIPNHKGFDKYCILMLQTVTHGVYLNNSSLGSQINTRNNKLIKLTNEAIYHIVKYMSNNPTVYQPSFCTKIIKRYMVGKLKIKNNKTTLTISENEKFNKTNSENNKMILTIPKDEKQHDTLWLAKHMYMFNNDTRQKYINSLSKHMLIFINKHREKYGKGILRMSQKKVKELSN
jgi:hypothetical protein